MLFRNGQKSGFLTIDGREKQQNKKIKKLGLFSLFPPSPLLFLCFSFVSQSKVGKVVVFGQNNNNNNNDNKH